jgi:putative DNA primase/helicase
VTLQDILPKFNNPKPAGGGYQAHCPAHDDKKASLSIKQGDKGVVLFCHAGCETRQIAAAIGIEVKDLFEGTNGHRQIVNTYDYRDEDGNVLYQVVRFEPKDFRQRKPDGAGGYLWSLSGVHRVPYRLPELLAADPKDYVFIVEGEKDVDALRGLGLTATCNVGGAGKWRDQYSVFLEGRSIVILPDNDEPGASHAGQVQTSLSRWAPSAMVRTLNLPGLPAKGDVSDWLRSGGTAERLLELATAVLTEPETEPEIEKTDPEYWRRTHEGLANEFLARFGHNLRYLKDLAGDLKGDHFAWWSGARWEFRTPAVAAVAAYQREMTAEFRGHSKNILGDFMFEDLDKTDKETLRFSKEIESHGFKSNWKQEIKGFPSIHMPLASFDADPFLLNCRNGTLDLRTGAVRPPRRDDYLTRILDIDYDPEAEAPRWESFLRRIFAGNETLIGYMRRVIGYTLTGDTSEQCLFLFYGPGANGKSVLVDVASAVLGDFAQASPMQTFTAKPNDNGASNDLARMRGARLVTASETNQGVRMNEALIKKVTGQDKITARFLFSEFFDYLPQFKLWLAMNHKPIIRGTDDGIWRRLRLIPFSVIIPEEERDKHLADKLKVELSGILAWAVGGCLDWQKNGMQTPPEVLNATDEYRSSQDVIGAFIEDACIIGEDYSVKASVLYREYKKWAEGASEHPATQTAFGLELGSRGFGKEHTRAGDFRLGIGLLINCE